MIGDGREFERDPAAPFHEGAPIVRTEQRMGSDHYVRENDDRSLGDLFSDLTRDFRTLVRQEIDLAKVESTEKAKKAGKNIGFIGAGGFVAYAGFIAIVFAIAYLMGEVMDLWLATLITGAIVVGVGYMLLQKGLKGLRETDFSLNKTVETLKEDKQWLKQEMK